VAEIRHRIEYLCCNNYRKTKKTASGEDKHQIYMKKPNRKPGTINKAFKYQLRPSKNRKGRVGKKLLAACGVCITISWIWKVTPTKNRQGAGLRWPGKTFGVLKKNPNTNGWKKSLHKLCSNLCSISGLPIQTSLKNERSYPGSRKSIINNPSGFHREFAWKVVSSIFSKLVG